jgi:hypothetical protein
MLILRRPSLFFNLGLGGPSTQRAQQSVVWMPPAHHNARGLSSASPSQGEAIIRSRCSHNRSGRELASTHRAGCGPGTDGCGSRMASLELADHRSLQGSLGSLPQGVRARHRAGLGTPESSPGSRWTWRVGRLPSVSYEPTVMDRASRRPQMQRTITSKDSVRGVGRIRWTRAEKSIPRDMLSSPAASRIGQVTDPPPFETSALPRRPLLFLPGACSRPALARGARRMIWRHGSERGTWILLFPYKVD